MNRLEVWIDDESLGGSAVVGHLVKSAGRAGDTISFEYDPGWLVDDHIHNPGFLRTGDGWQLSPAFDVNPNTDKDHHVLAIDERDPSPDSGLLLATADYYRLPGKILEAMSRHVRETVRGWHVRARALGATGSDIALMQTVIDPDR